MPKEVFQARLREVLEPSWSDLRAILAELEAILGRFGGGWGGGKLIVFPFVFQYFLKHHFFA